MIQSYKKQGLEEAENEFICSERSIFLRGIPKSLVEATKIDLEHLTCQLCGNIIWKAVACSQNNCFANFCEYCVSNYSQQNIIDKSVDDNVCSKCPKCSKIFHKTSIPLVNNLLSDLKIKCFNHASGCEAIVSYDSYLKHCIGCDYRKLPCQGCKQNFLRKQISSHQKICDKIMIKCEKCYLQLPQLQYATIHTPIHCLEQQLAKKTSKIDELEVKLSSLQIRLNQYEQLIQKIIKGQNLQLPYQLYSSFPTNYQFIPDMQSCENFHKSTQAMSENMIVKLCKASYNTAKQKYDFLHFYIASPIKTESPIGFQWKMVINKLKGNLLIGICSSLQINSVDFVINRFGEIKKKESSENKYRLIRKCDLIFSEGDVITFKYMALRKILRIENQSKKIEGRLDQREIMELGDLLYSFYSLDTAGDMVSFIIK